MCKCPEVTYRQLYRRIVDESERPARRWRACSLRNDYKSRHKKNRDLGHGWALPNICGSTRWRPSQPAAFYLTLRESQQARTAWRGDCFAIDPDKRLKQTVQPLSEEAHPQQAANYHPSRMPSGTRPYERYSLDCQFSTRCPSPDM